MVTKTPSLSGKMHGVELLEVEQSLFEGSFINDNISSIRENLAKANYEQFHPVLQHHWHHWGACASPAFPGSFGPQTASPKFHGT